MLCFLGLVFVTAIQYFIPLLIIDSQSFFICLFLDTVGKATKTIPVCVFW